MSFYYTLGQTYRPQNLFVGYTTGSLNLDDLACPTWGLSDPMTNVFTQGGSVYTDIYRTIGPPFFPIIVPHSEVLNLNTEWASSCTTIIDNVEGQSVTYGLNDPPHPLTAQPPLSVPASNPAPDPTPTAIPQTTKGSDTTMFDPSTASNLGPPQPQSTPSPDGPRPTNQAPNPPANGDPGSNTPPVNSGGGGSGGGSNQNPSPGQQPNPGGIGGIIISMFDPPPYRPVPPQTIGLPSQLPPDSPPLTLTTAVNGHDYTFTILPTAPGSGSNDGGLAVPGVPSEPGHPAVIVDGSTISQGGPPVTLSDGSVMSVGNDGKLVATPGSGTGGTRTVTTNGQTFTLISGPGGPGETVLVGGQTMTRGGSGVTVDGNSYSVNGGGDLIVASASGSLQTASSAATLEISWHWIGTCITGWFAWTIL